MDSSNDWILCVYVVGIIYVLLKNFMFMYIR